jgi:hypothetical protein
MITGAGETKSTPDIVVSMMDLDPTMTNPKPASYLAIADGEKQLNMAKVVRRNTAQLYYFNWEELHFLTFWDFSLSLFLSSSPFFFSFFFFCFVFCC